MNDTAELEWYYAQGDQRFGPVTTAAMLSAVEDGRIKPASLVWHSKLTEWVPASTLPELFPPAAGSSGTTASMASSKTVSGSGDTASSMGNMAGDAQQFVKNALPDVLAAVKAIAVDPAAGVTQAVEGLGKMRTLIVGAAFILLFDATVFLALLRMYFSYPKGVSIGVWQWILSPFVGLLVAIGFVLAVMVSRLIFRGRGTIESDTYLAGVILLPLSIAALLTMVLGVAPGSMSFTGFTVSALFVTTFCVAVIMLYRGVGGVLGLEGAKATWCTPLILLLGMVISGMLLRLLMFNPVDVHMAA